MANAPTTHYEIKSGTEVHPPLADAPLFALVDCRGESELLYRYFVAYRDSKTGKILKGVEDLDDIDDEATPEGNAWYMKFASDEEIAVARAQNKRLRELDSSADPNDILIDRHDLPMEPHLLEKVRMLFGPRPKSFDHYDLVRGITTHMKNYQVVSREWRDAVEALEPGVHDFLPLRLEFYDPSRSREKMASHDVFVLRTRTVISRHSPAEFGFYFSPIIKLRPPELCFANEAIAGKHWFSAGNHQRTKIVSQSLGLRLLSILPPNVYLLPIAAN